VGTSFDIYSEVLQGLRKFEVPARLEREEAVGVVEMLQAWRGVREGELKLGASAHSSYRFTDCRYEP
jgi:hypothetical protein